jgi:hypothetical protein
MQMFDTSIYTIYVMTEMRYFDEPADRLTVVPGYI